VRLIVKKRREKKEEAIWLRSGRDKEENKEKTKREKGSIRSKRVEKKKKAREVQREVWTVEFNSTNFTPEEPDTQPRRQANNK
jgi:hypothetical protein